MTFENKRPLSRIILDEIALEGLEGITIPSLWVYIANAWELSLPLGEQLQNQVWSFILKIKEHLKFYELPEERAVVKLYNRFENLDPVLGMPVDPDICPFIRYKCVPIQDGNILGSCETYKTRQEIPIEKLYEKTVEDVLKEWGDKLVIVASQDLRFNVLTPVNVTIIKDMTPPQYCILEAIGRSRYNGETTAGNWSLQDYCKDATIVFYIKNKLVRYGLVAIQTFTEKRKERIFATTLLTLPRFYLMHKNIFNSVMERLIQELKKKPKYRITMTEAHKYFPAEKPKTFRKVIMAHDFRRIFEIVNIPIHQAADVMEIPKNSRPERLIQVLQLKNPNVTFEEVFADQETEEKEEIIGDFHSEKHSYVDMPVNEEFYRAIERHGSTGASLTDICNYTGMQHYTVRHLVKKAQKDGLITSYFMDAGRQRTSMYVVIKYSNAVKEKRNEKNDVLKNLQCTEEPNIVATTDIILPDIPSINARVKVHEFKKYSLTRESTTRQLQRRALIVKTIDERCIVTVSDMRHIINNAEKANGHTDEVCQKSVRRLLSYLMEAGIVKTYEIILQCDKLIRIYRYITHPKIEPNHDIIQKEIFKLKNSLYLIMEEKRVRMRNKISPIKNASKTVERKELLTLNSYKSPKFLVSRHLHEFLFYVTYELKNNQNPLPITEKLIGQWKQEEPNLAVQEYYDSVVKENAGLVAYRKEINWRTFVPPLPKYEGKPVGWFLFLDTIERIPLSLFNKIFRINKCVDECIAEYLNHPIRQHYLIKQLPCDLQYCISRTRLQSIYISILKLLNNMGLVQVSERTVKDPLQVWIYLNKRAQILDTTTSEPSYAKVNPDRTYTPTHYHFKRFDDVLSYWNTLQNICVHTPLGFRKGAPRRKPGKNPEIVFIGTVDFEDAKRHDVGTVPGDRLGAAGLSSHLYAHTFRNWSWIVETESKPKPVKSSRTLRTPRYKVSKLLLQSRKHVQLSNRLSVVPLKRLQLKTASIHTVKYVKKDTIRDAIDRDALKNMRTLRVSWRKEEDDIIKMARATYMFIGTSPVVFNLVDVAKIVRDVLRHNLGIYNKTSQAVMRRGTFIIKMNRHLPEVPSWLHFLQTNDEMQKIYCDDITTKLRKAYPNKNDFLNALKIHFMHILTFLYKYVKNNGEVIQRPHFIIPDSVAEFEHKFKECTPVREDRILQYLNPETNVDLQIITVINVLHSSLCCSRDKTLYNLQAFEIYKHFSEEVLNAAFKKARSNELIVAIKRKNMHVAPSHVAGPAYLFSQKYRVRLLYLKIPYGVYDVIFAFYNNILKFLFNGKHTMEDSDQHFEIKSPNAGQLILISEGLARNLWSISFKLPINILTVDANQRQTVSSFDRILDHFHSILDNAPATEYSKQLEMGVAEKEIRIKFHPANLSYKIHYTPYDIISKLPPRYLHFFCALDHLNQEVDINFSKLQRKDNEHDILVMECPFSCIMKHSNYINAIERIVQEKKLVLRELQEMPPQKLLNLATTASTVMVQTSNLLTLVRMLESFWREKELQLERKDLGKISATLKSTKSIDWHQLCEDILEFNSNEIKLENNDEYEPQLNKEERIVRAQDVFVINLPTLKLSASNELPDKLNVVNQEEVNVPKSFAKTVQQREAVLEKVLTDSRWKYTENTMETLKPILQERNFSAMEQQHLQEIHNFIKSNTLGVSSTELMKEFPYKFLFRALQVLCEFFLIKRVGVSTFMYVHKLHIRPWVVHTFHIKRLQRENLGSTAKVKRKHENVAAELKDDNCDDADEEDDNIDVAPSTSKKHKLSEMQIDELVDDDNCDDDIVVAPSTSNKHKLSEMQIDDDTPDDIDEAPSTSKKHKQSQIQIDDDTPDDIDEAPSTSKKHKQSQMQIDDDTPSTSNNVVKRISIPKKPFDSESTEIRDDFIKNIIVMKPQPWIRLNGSLNRRVLDKWIGTILIECISRTGCFVQDILLRFPHMLPVDVMFLLELLCDLECIYLKELRSCEVNLLSEPDVIEESYVCENELYDPEETFIIPQLDALTKLAIFIGNKKYNSDFF